MDLGDNLRDSFDYTRKLFSDAGRLIILIVLSIVSLGGLIPVLGWLLLGYWARVLKESPSTGTPPKLEKYGELLVDGAKVYFAALIYMIIPIILVVVGGVSTFAGVMSASGPALAAGLVLGGAGAVIVLIGIILMVLLLIILAVGIANMIKTGKFGKAFGFGEIFSVIRMTGWGKYLGWIVIIVVIDVILGALSGLIPVAGGLISLVIHSVFGVFVFRSLGLLYNDGAPPGLRATAPVVVGFACSSCGTPLQPHHKFCPNCGAAALAPPPPTAEGGTKFCISCGAKIPATATFCGSCGAKQT